MPLGSSYPSYGSLGKARAFPVTAAGQFGARTSTFSRCLVVAAQSHSGSSAQRPRETGRAQRPRLRSQRPGRWPGPLPFPRAASTQVGDQTRGLGRCTVMLEKREPHTGRSSTQNPALGYKSGTRVLIPALLFISGFAELSPFSRPECPSSTKRRFFRESCLAARIMLGGE